MLLATGKRPIVKGADWPWFSALRWWQKLLIALTLFVVLLSFALAPRHVTVWIVIVGAGINLLVHVATGIVATAHDAGGSDTGSSTP